MGDVRAYTTWLRILSARIDEAVVREPTLEFRTGADISLHVPPARLSYAAAAFGYGEQWETTTSGIGFTRSFGPHKAWLFADQAPALVDTSPVRALRGLETRPGPRGVA